MIEESRILADLKHWHHRVYSAAGISRVGGAQWRLTSAEVADLAVVLADAIETIEESADPWGAAAESGRAVLENAALVLDQLAGNLRGAAVRYDNGATPTSSDLAAIAEDIAYAYVERGWHDPTPVRSTCFGFDRTTGQRCQRWAAHDGPCDSETDT